MKTQCMPIRKLKLQPTIRKTNPASLSHDNDHNQVRQPGKKEVKVAADNCDAAHDDKGGETNAEARQKIAAMTRAKKVMGKYLANSINVLMRVGLRIEFVPFVA